MNCNKTNSEKGKMARFEGIWKASKPLIYVFHQKRAARAGGRQNIATRLFRTNGIFWSHRNPSMRV